ALAHRSPFFSSFKTMEIGLDCINRDHIMLSRNIRPVTPITRRLSTDKTQFFSILVICLLLIPKPIPEVFTGELIFYGLRDFILVLPCGHVFLAGFDAAQLEKIAVHSDGVIVEKSRVPIESVSQFDLHNASESVSIVDNSLHFVKNFSRFVLKGLATHVYNSLLFVGQTDPIKPDNHSTDQNLDNHADQTTPRSNRTLLLLGNFHLHILRLAYRFWFRRARCQAIFSFSF